MSLDSAESGELTRSTDLLYVGSVVPAVLSLVRVVAGRVLRSLGCIVCRGITWQPCPCQHCLHPAPLSTAPSADQPSQHAPCSGPCILSETACLSRDSCLRVQAGAPAGPPPCHRALTLPTKPDVNLDCVLAAARVCAALSPQKISTTRL